MMFVRIFLFASVAVSAFTLRAPTRHTTAIGSGYGIASNYTWQEEAFELDVTVQVPADTKAKDVIFKASPKYIDLKVKRPDGTELQLLDGTRPLRGKVNLDGTFWMIADRSESTTGRDITVTIEKIIATPRDDFAVVEYDWKGVYAKEDEGEVSERKYDEAEELNVREYAASLGVDIDNINASMVDKTMFSSGLNLTQKSLEQLEDAGYLRQVTRQADGTEYIVDEEGQAQELAPLGDPTIGRDELSEATPKIPFLDTDSPWNQAVKVQHDPLTNQTYVQQTRNLTRAAFAEDAAKTTLPKATANDPIDLLTVARLKEILKSQGLPTSGNKAELQERLRAQVNSLLQGQPQQQSAQDGSSGAGSKQ